MRKRKDTTGWQPRFLRDLRHCKGGRLGSGSGESQGWGGRTPIVDSGGKERPGRGIWGRWLYGGERGIRSSPAAACSPLPPVGAPSRALIGAAAAAGRVSAASLRDATPSNCGRDRRYAAASCPGARPGQPRLRPAPRPPGRAGTLRHGREATSPASLGSA